MCGHEVPWPKLPWEMSLDLGDGCSEPLARNGEWSPCHLEGHPSCCQGGWPCALVTPTVILESVAEVLGVEPRPWDPKVQGNMGVLGLSL